MIDFLNQFPGLLKQFQATCEKQQQLQIQYEKREDFGMAYLALWVIAEDFAKHLGPICQRIELKQGLTDWLEFLQSENADENPPTTISVGKFKLAKARTEKIPTESSLINILPKSHAQSFYDLLATDKKFRKTRNSVAHSGEWISQKRYEDFKEQALAAHDEIEKWLMKNITSLDKLND